MKDSKQTEYNWLGRSLSNYLEMHRSKFKEKGIDTSKIKTLTEARKLAFGLKRKHTR